MVEAKQPSREIFTFPFNNARQIISIGVALPTVCILVVVLRFLTRLLQKVRLGLDDWLSLGGLMAVIGMGACLVDGAVRKGLGYPTPEGSASVSSFEQFSYIDPRSVLVLKLQFAFQLIMMLSNGFIKLSIIAFYRRIFVTNKNSPFDIVTKILAVVVFLWTMAFFLIDIFACGGHVTASWGSLAEQSKYCDTIGYTSEEGFAVSDLIINVIVITSPLPLVWALHMTTVRKFGVTCVLLLGAAATAASIARLVIYIEILHATEASVDLDTNLCITATLWWSMLEAGISLIAACLPSLSYLITRFPLQSVLKSVRSKLSLELLRSSPRTTPKTRSLGNAEESYTEIDSTSSTGSQAEIFPQDSHAMSNLRPSTQGIRVTHEVKLADSVV